MKDYKASYKILKPSLEEKGINVSKVKKKLKTLKIETPKKR
jgi:L-rhamnose isomerase/sugar isomerase